MTRRVAIIGAGIGKEHLAGYLQLPDRFSVATLCDLDKERAASVLAGRQDITIETELGAVLADPSIDLVDVCLPPHLHFSTCVAALEAGKEVVCEKPLVGSLQEADLLAQKSNETGKTVFPVFQYRYGQGTAILKALMQDGFAGKPLTASIETHWHRDANYYANPWRGTWKGEQGGAVLGHAIHNHDLLCRVLGPIKRLAAMTATRVNDIEVEDCAAISLEMENGALATSSITLGAADDTTRLRFCFEHLTAESGTEPYAPAEGAWTFKARGNADQDTLDRFISKQPVARPGFAGFFEAVADFLDKRGNDAVMLEDGRRSMELVTAIYHSGRTGEFVNLPLDNAHPLYDGWMPGTERL
ncbi:Gfo/Idh/MocA family protein [Hoeflea prorocentri]|uniref:Gfo/Idh/MocA family oxidoreductase n=1 Tax=Hoeflea prorocentri TaxID=1922333 RepID=A0A9X3UFK4_9HYPH|nr:Gfo/Idh/MocA family oxidoreductase [Hoeflea prorocentri]MCY6379796.1 Gfo/Idh/MocA family oxidoreductase [Hoeflea prorocentri]MDA5397596.1 Gfo/Idh/MocA family oxidoreductase [Hoeflea prorocentri]